MFCEYMNNSDNNIDLTEDYDMSSKNSYNYKNMCSNYNTHHPENLDSIVSSVITQFRKRAKFGMEKYGTDLDREDLTFLEWVQHAQEEHMDAILYLEKIKQTEESRLVSTCSESTVYLYIAIYVAFMAVLLLAMKPIMDKLPM